MKNEMKSRTNHGSRAQRANGFQREGPNWVLVAGGALLSTLSIRLGYKLKQVLDPKQPETNGNGSNGLLSSQQFSRTLNLYLCS